MWLFAESDVQVGLPVSFPDIGLHPGRTGFNPPLSVGKKGHGFCNSGIQSAQGGSLKGNAPAGRNALETAPTACSTVLML